MSLMPGQAQSAAPLTGTEQQLLVQNGKLVRAQINAVITFARTGYSTDNLPEGATNRYFTEARVMAAVSSALASKATPADVSTAINALINAAPSTLDTIKELADAIGDDPNFSVTMANALAQRLRVDSAQSLTPAQQAQGRTNLGLGSAALKAISDFAAFVHSHTFADITGLQVALDAKAAAPVAATKRTLAFGTAYQATTPSRPAFVSAVLDADYTLTLAGTLTDTCELYFSPTAAGALAGTGGFSASTYRAALKGIAVSVGMGLGNRNQVVGLLPAGWYFAIRRVAGTTATIVDGQDQAL